MTSTIGHLHPLLVHLPIGILLLVCVVSLLPKQKWESMEEAVKLALLAASIGALASCVAGYLLSLSGEYEEKLVSLHLKLGIATAVLSVISYFVAPYRRQLIWITTVTMAVASHYGGTLTHGEGFLFGSTQDPGIAQDQQQPSTDTAIIGDTDTLFYSAYQQEIQPILKQKCYNCHSASKMKGGLRLDAEAFIRKGGKHGSILKPNDPQHSKLYTHLLLPMEDDNHMPPKGKKQLSSAEIESIQQWIAAGASFAANKKTTKETEANAVSKTNADPIASMAIPTTNLSKPLKMDAAVMQEYQSITAQLDYNMDVKPILSDKCFACHGPDKAKQKAGLRLDKSASAFGPLPESPGKFAIRSRDIKNSEVFHRILSHDPEYAMPTPGSHMTLTAKEKATIIKWIEQGAEYKPHWAFVKPERKEPPVVMGTENAIDRFVRARLNSMNLQPSAKSSKELLLRRASLDITGLPPTPEEIDAFLADKSANAFEKQVDRLLRSPHYGERMAAEWLDLARYADTHGYTVDRMRDMSPYRDWVINAFNKNMRYDRFIHEQLAGDLMPNPNRNMIIATAFNRNHQQNMEGGIVEEEFQTEYVMDRTNTFGEAFMAMSIGCARCHDHKYDPISQKNYYQVYSFFNNVLEAGQISWNDDIPTPALPLPTEQQETVIRALQQTISDKEKEMVSQYLLSKDRATTWISEEKYKSLQEQKIPIKGLISHHSLNGTLADQLDTSKKGEMEHDWGSKGDKPVFTKGKENEGLLMNGDVYLDLNHTGVFRSADPFTIGIWVWIPKNFKEGVIFHKADAERLYNFKGYSVSVKNNRFELIMAHTAPSNAIIKKTQQDIPRDKWIHLSLVYDGSSKAAGLDLYQDGAKLATEIIKDKLYKDIIFFNKNEPALQIGGWYRGSGFTGGKVDEILVYNRRLTEFELGMLAGKNNWTAVAAKPQDQLTVQDRAILSSYYSNAIDQSVSTSLQELKASRITLLDAMRQVKELMVMEEMSTPKKSYLLQRGQYDMKGEEVSANTPEEILRFPKGLPKNRYGLAQWLTHPDHPLTARVAVNRIWQQFFGMGLVKTSEDFGNQGALPSHPELLDWLAVEFRESGWDVQHIIKLIVLSDTYQQSSVATPSLREMDPENKWLARGPANRLTAEMMRDNALAAAGLLNRKTGGPSVKPYQPSGLWEINSASYQQDSTDAVYRRSLYVVAKRTVPHPTLATFDASERSSCLSRRQKTNTPLQALVLLNDPTYVEASKVLGEQMTQFDNASDAIRYAYRRLSARIPSEKELQLLLALKKSELEKFNSKPEKAKGWLTTGLYKTNKQLNPAMIAANAVVANTILNSDAVITKR
jgi:mono/diheme cytochrome c family protein/uncharacterized membrane protein